MTGLLGLVFSLVALECIAMQPVSYSGTWASSAYINNTNEVLSEKVYIDISDDFSSASYTIEYELFSHQAGQQIPLVFEVINDSERYSEQQVDAEFIIKVDGHDVAVQTIDDNEDQSAPIGAQKDFANKEPVSTQDFYTNQGEKVKNQFRPQSKFIEVNLSRGRHLIQAIYPAVPHYYGSDWTGRDTYSLSLLPIKKGERFKGTIIEMTFNGNSDYVTVDIEGEKERPLLATRRWQFADERPNEIAWRYQKVPNLLAQFLIAIPFWLVIGIALLLLAWRHYHLMQESQPKPSHNRWQVVLFGGLLIPFLALMIYYFYLLVTDMIIGKGATGESRDMFFIFIFPFCYILITPCYLVASAIAFSVLRQRYKANIEP